MIRYLVVKNIEMADTKDFLPLFCLFVHSKVSNSAVVIKSLLNRFQKLNSLIIFI